MKNVDKKLLIIASIPFIAWAGLISTTLGNLSKELILPLVCFAVLFLLLVVATSWTSKSSAYIAVALALLALIPLYLESQSASGQYTANLFPFIAIAFLLFYAVLNYFKVKRLNH